ncbi:MAG: hypothetical protein ABEL76_15315 [Bradymonadaceae bacterium]
MPRCRRREVGRGLTDASPPDDDSDEDLSAYLMACLHLAFVVLASTGHTGGPDDPHHLARGDDLPGGGGV